MKTLIYGCSLRLKNTLAHFNLNLDGIEFTDSNADMWGSEFIISGRGKKRILPQNQINVNDYDLCLIGSFKYEDEIRKELLSLGFNEYQIIPFGYINSLWERWKKKDDFFEIWKKSIEKIPNCLVIKNWYMSGENAECIISIKGSILSEVVLSVFDIYKEKRNISIVDLSKDKVIKLNEEKLSFDSCSEESVIKIIVSNAVAGIPWIMIQHNDLPIKKEIKNSKLGKNLLSTYIQSERIPYYDEDYMVIKRAANCNGTILDVGAQFGQSLYAFNYLTEQCNIISIEANPNCCKELEILQRIIDDKNRISLIECGVSDKEENLIFYEPVNPSIAGSFDAAFLEGRKLGVDVNERLIKVAPLDELVSDHNNIWFLKLDVEGLEYQALLGAKDIIKCNYPMILIEQNDKIPTIREYLNDEYEIFYYDVYEDKFLQERHSRLNCWLIPKEQYRTEVVRIIVEGRL